MISHKIIMSNNIFTNNILTTGFETYITRSNELADKIIEKRPEWDVVKYEEYWYCHITIPNRVKINIAALALASPNIYEIMIIQIYDPSLSNASITPNPINEEDIARFASINATITHIEQYTTDNNNNNNNNNHPSPDFDYEPLPIR